MLAVHPVYGPAALAATSSHINAFECNSALRQVCGLVGSSCKLKMSAAETVGGSRKAISTKRKLQTSSFACSLFSSKPF
jgi:hypothetical protein